MFHIFLMSAYDYKSNYVSGFTPMLTGKRWAEDLMSGMGWRFDPIEGHVTEDLHRIRYISNQLGPRCV